MLAGLAGATGADLAVLRNHGDLFGSVASDATAWRLLDGTDDASPARGSIDPSGRARWLRPVASGEMRRRAAGALPAARQQRCGR